MLPEYPAQHFGEPIAGQREPLLGDLRRLVQVALGQVRCRGGRVAGAQVGTVGQGAGDLATYTFGTGVAKHTFCSTCGIHPFYTPRSHPDGVDVNVRCLDGDAASRFTVEPFDGQNWEANVERIR